MFGKDKDPFKKIHKKALATPKKRFLSGKRITYMGIGVLTLTSFGIFYTRPHDDVNANVNASSEVAYEGVIPKKEIQSVQEPIGQKYEDLENRVSYELTPKLESMKNMALNGGYPANQAEYFLALKKRLESGEDKIEEKNSLIGFSNVLNNSEYGFDMLSKAYKSATKEEPSK